MTPRLDRIRTALRADERREVIGYMALQRLPPRDRLHPEPEEALMRGEMRARKEELEAWAASRAISLRIPDGTPLIYATLGPSDIDALARHPAVWMLAPYDGLGSPGSQAWHPTIGADLNANSGWTGGGISVANIESGDIDNYSYVTVGAVLCTNCTGNIHYRQTTQVLRENSGLLGAAPAATILIASLNSPTLPELWAASAGARVFNASWAFNANIDEPIQPIELWHDQIALAYPYPLYVKITHQVGGNTFSNNRGYNGLIVGGTNDQGTSSRSDDGIYNPANTLNYTSPNGDREIPEISAPAVDVSVASSTESGTSFASPMVAATAAVVHARYVGFASYPEGVKAVLMATADCNVHGPLLNLSDQVDDRDGTGELNARLAAQLASGANHRSTSTPATDRGYMFGSMVFANDFSSAYWNRSPEIIPSSTGYVSIVLTWDATPVGTCSPSSGCTSQGPDADLNLLLTDITGGGSTIVASSLSLDNNYEVIQTQLTANHTYRLDVLGYNFLRSQTFYGLAWAPFSPTCANPI